MDIRKLKDAPKERWFEIVTPAGSFEALVGPYGSPAWRTRWAELERPHLEKKRENGGDLPPEVNAKIMGQCLAEVCLKDWRNIDDDGTPVPYSTDAAIDLLTDDHCREGIAQAALRLARVEAKELTESGKT